METLNKLKAIFRSIRGKTITKSILVFVILFFLIFSLNNCTEKEKLKDGGLRIGWAIEDITPSGPVSLSGQYYERLSTYVQSPLEATAFAIESTDEKGSKDQAIMVSVDLVGINRDLQDTLRSMIREQIHDFDVRKLMLNVTHTHSAPNPDDDTEYRKLVLDRAGKAAVTAWRNRKPAGISRSLGYAVVGHNRRVQYANGTTEMYGRTDREDFIGIEGPTNSGVDMLFCWDMKKKLTGIIMNVSCPSQVTEAKYYVSADYWSEVRKQLKERFSENVYVLPQCGAAGDISPRDLSRDYKAGEPNMWDIPGIIEIGKRLAHVVDEAYPDASNSIKTKVVFKHSVKDINIPTRRVSKEEYKKAQEIVNKIRSIEPKDPKSPETAWNRFLKEMKDNEKIKEYGPWDSKTSDYGWLKPMEAVLKQYNDQDKDTVYKMELHVIRLDDVAFTTNPFELFTDYGLMITGRSKARQTFIIQLCGDTGGYLPTERALPGGGYSAMANHIGPAGGQVLVNETVNMINALWE